MINPVNQPASDTARIRKILRILKTTYPSVKTQLTHANPFELLAATILSAQCTDAQVNRVTPKLFVRWPTPEALAAAPAVRIERVIFSTGFYRNKAKNLKACAQALVERHGGRVPSDMASLVALPGVGRKTANVVLSAAFGQPAVVVDTHVGRIAQRLGLSRHTDPVRIEQDVMAVVPKSRWSDLSLELIYLGRETCRARSPLCGQCPLYADCPWPGKTA